MAALGQFKVERLFGEPVRIWHLLTHTAGFDQLFLARESARESYRFSLATFLNGNLVRVPPPARLLPMPRTGSPSPGTGEARCRVTDKLRMVKDGQCILAITLTRER